MSLRALLKLCLLPLLLLGATRAAAEDEAPAAPPTGAEVSDAGAVATPEVPAPAPEPAPPAPAPEPLISRVLGPKTCSLMPLGLCLPKEFTWETTPDLLVRRCYERNADGSRALDGLLADLGEKLQKELRLHTRIETRPDALLKKVLRYRTCVLPMQEGQTAAAGEQREINLAFFENDREREELVAVTLEYVKTGSMDFEVLRDRYVKDAAALVGEAKMVERRQARFFLPRTPTEQGVYYFEPQGDAENRPPNRLFVSKSVTRTDALPVVADAVKRKVHAEWLRDELASTSMPDLKELAAYRVAVARKKLDADPDQVVRELEPLLAFPIDEPEVRGVLEQARAAIQKREESRLESVLTREVGKGGPVAVLATAKGLLAVGTQSKESRVLSPGVVRWALVDNRARVIWYGRSNKKESMIYIQDLLGKQEEIIAVAGLPPNLDVAIEHDGDFLRFDEPGNPNVIVGMAPRARAFSFNGGNAGEFDPSSVRGLAQAVSRARVETKLLDFLRKRTQSTPKQADAPSPAKKLVQLGKKPCAEANGLNCLPALEIPGTTIWAVQTEMMCGDGCYFTHELYDSATKQFFDVAAPKKRASVPHKQVTSLSGARISGDGTAIVIAGQAVRLADGTMFGQKGLGGGFVGSEWAVPLPYEQ